ncbi:MAG: hypothetical protein ACREIQ_04565, partial [Nitrospiria bacterium]
MELKQGMQRCPAHDDNRASLSVKQVDDRWLLFCHAGCETSDVLKAAGLTWADLGVGQEGGNLTLDVVDVYTYKNDDLYNT